MPVARSFLAAQSLGLHPKFNESILRLDCKQSILRTVRVESPMKFASFLEKLIIFSTHIFDLVLKILDFNNEQLRTKKTAKVVRREYKGYPLSHPGFLLGIPQCHFLTRSVPNICCPSRNLHWSSQRNQSIPCQSVVAAYSFQSKIKNVKSKM